jgi:hypothetical protein
VTEHENKAFDFVADLTKQLITLSTGIVTITLLLSKDFTGPRIPALLAWTFYLLSTLCGLWALMALTGTLAPLKVHAAKPHAHKPSSAAPAESDGEHLHIGSNVRRPSTAQIVTFAMATLLTLVYVFGAFLHAPKPAAPATNCCCQCQPTPATK